jgi:hypothetical protein
MPSDDFREGYRIGFEAGKASASLTFGRVDTALHALASEPSVRRPRVLGPKCVDCGHAFSTHNDLGYCQARGKAGSDGCHCDYAMDAEQRAQIDARNRKT